MPIEILDERDPTATRAILESLPSWFGIPEAVTNYVEEASSSQFRSLVARDQGRAVGVTLVDRHFPETARFISSPFRAGIVVRASGEQ